MNKQIRLLKKINKSASFDYSNQTDEIISIINYLQTRGFINCNEEFTKYGEPTGKLSCTISQDGLYYLYDLRRTIIFWLIPNILSVLALIISIIALSK